MKTPKSSKAARRSCVKAALVGAAFMGALAVACGGAPAQYASSPPQHAEAPASEAASTTPPAGAAAGASPATAADATSTVAPRPSSGAVAAAAQFDSSSASLESSLGDCRKACRALSSMDRACGNLCSLGDDRERCSDDTTRLKGARDRVRAACVTCPDGTRVDHDAPIPSGPSTP